MDLPHIIYAAGFACAVGAFVYARVIKGSHSAAREARARAQLRSRGELDSVPFVGGVVVDHFDPYGEITDSQYQVIALMEQGFRPELKQNTYKFSGTPLSRVAGVPENFNHFDRV